MSTAGIGMNTRVLFETLGSKNIEVDSIVFAEQIKNSYDAHSKTITLDFSEYENDKITIYDDGDGMDYEEILYNWFFIGTDSKSNNSKMLGGKGIGRFSLFRIADSISIFTKKADKIEYSFVIDKADLENANDINEVAVNIEENRIPLFFKKADNRKKGTAIILTKIKKINLKDIYIDLYNIITPNLKKKPIDIQYLYPKKFIKPIIKSIKYNINYAPFKCSATFRRNELTSYEFICEFKNKIIYKNLNPADLVNNMKELQDADLGEIKITLYNFYFKPEFIKKYDIPKDDINNLFLNIYQGISVYRENFKIYGHGRNDWLKLAEKRVANPGKCIDNKLSFGYINLKRPNSDTLEEKTSREGFIKNEYFEYFLAATNILIDQFSKDRNKSKGKLMIVNFNELVENNTKDNPENKSKSTHKDESEINPQNKGNSTTAKDVNETNPENGQQSELKDASKTNSENKNNSTSKDDTEPEDKKRGSSSRKFNDKVIIDVSYQVDGLVPEKIKRIIYELKSIKSQYINAQALLLRCLLDISTEYIQDNVLSIKRLKNNLYGNIKNVLDYMSNNNKIDAKYISRMRSELRQTRIIEYFNGVAHEYNYRPNYEILKRVWDTFEEYVTFCINCKKQ